VPEDYRLEHAITEGHGTVAVAQRLTHDIHHLVLDVEEPTDFAYAPGQYVELCTPEGEVSRSYSMANLPGSGRLEFIVRAYPGGAFSSLLEAGLEPGTPLRFTGPYGGFRLRSTSRDVLMVAGGSGMAPVLALLRQLGEQGSDRKVRFFYGARTAADLFYRDVVTELGSQLADFVYTEVLSEPEGADWTGETGLVHAAAATALGSGDLAQPEVYTCGPPPMIDALVAELTSAHGVDERDISYDKFTVSADA
jgi:propane monooxygenase reductase subunit